MLQTTSSKSGHSPTMLPDYFAPDIAQASALASVPSISDFHADILDAGTRIQGRILDDLIESQKAAHRASTKLLKAWSRVGDIQTRQVRLASEALSFSDERVRIELVQSLKAVYHRQPVDVPGIRFGSVYRPDLSFPEDYDRDICEFEYALIAANWPPIEGAPPTFVGTVVRTHREQGVFTLRGTLNQIVPSYYDEKGLQCLLEKWKQFPFLQRRIPILSQVISCHSSGNFALSINRCFSEIEGIIAGAVRITGYFSTAALKKQYTLLAQKLYPTDLAALLAKNVFNPLYAEFRWGDDVSPELLRHAIMHGASIEYGTEINSLRAILILDHVIRLTCQHLAN